MLTSLEDFANAVMNMEGSEFSSQPFLKEDALRVASDGERLILISVFIHPSYESSCSLSFSRKLCWKALEACLTLVSHIPTGTAGAARRFYVTPAHAEHMDDRFTSFDSYFCSLNGEQFHEYTRLTRRSS